MLRFLYETVPGRAALKVLASPGLSRLAGRFLDSSLSRGLIPRFVKGNGIRLEDYESDNFRCFNDCFTRKIHQGLRPLPADPNELMAPCDGLLSAYRVEEGAVLPIKQSSYTVADLLGDRTLAERYRDGLCLVFRLCVDHYHRYCYVDDGTKGPNIFLPGRLHTVRPVALAARPVFVQNCREYTVMDTDHFGRVTQVEVGAMLVGKIRNHHGPGPVRRGEEKGMFLYGGSTIVLLLEKGAVRLDQTFLQATARGEECPVQMGQTIGQACR